MQTVLITGCSSGFGLETARHFHDRGWTVVATMRTPRADVLPASERMRVLPLDVTDADSIAAVIAAAGPIDALVNNAGIGWLNAVESTPMGVVRDILETNTLGTIAMTQAVIPQFRQRRSGVVVNVTSTVTLKALPLLAVYTASKAAVNAFTEVLDLEMRPFGVRVRVVLPGRAPDTRFGDNARTRIGANGGFQEPYQPMVQDILAGWEADRGPVTEAADVAEAVWRAVTEQDTAMFIPAGADAVEIAARKAA